MTTSITDHIVNPANQELSILTMDNPGSGGAHRHYHIAGFNSETNPSDPFTRRHGIPATYMSILFQNGPIQEVGVNGVTHESLLAVVIHRLKCFQEGPFACKENEMALLKIQEAMHWMQQRTLRRIRAGVEGTHKPTEGDGQ